MKTSDNPLLQEFNTPFNTAPFSIITEDLYEDAFAKAIKIAQEEITLITCNKDEPSFENTIEALDKAGEKLGRISSIFFNLNSAETKDEIQRIAREVSPQLSKFSNDVTLNLDLFERVKHVYNKRDQLDLNPEQLTLLDKKYKRFSRNGALLDDKQKERLREIDTQLAQLSLQFGENVLAATNAFEMHITDESKLSGLPESALEAAKETATPFS